MALRAPVGGTRKPIPAGTYVARLVRVIDMGTFDDPKSKYGPKHEVRFMFEIPSKRVTWKENDEEREGPAAVWHRFSLSMNKKSNLRHFVEAWTGKKMTDKDASTFDIGSLLEKACMLGIQHDETGSYANVVTVSALPEGIACAAQETPTMYLELTREGYDEAMFQALGDWFKDRIKATPEWQYATGLIGDPDGDPSAGDAGADGFDEPPSDDEVPF